MVTHKGNDLPLSCSELDHEQGWGDNQTRNHEDGRLTRRFLVVTGRISVA